MNSGNRNDKNRFSLLSLIIWNALIFTTLMFVLLNLLQRVFIEAIFGVEELIFFVLIPILLIINIRVIFINIKKLTLSSRENQDGEMLKIEFKPDRYAFMNMYQKLSMRRICLLLFLPLLFAFVFVGFFSFLSRGHFLWESVHTMFTYRSIFFSFLPVVFIPTFISLKIYLSSRYNIEVLSQIYANLSKEEQEDIDCIKEKQAAYVFTEEFLINWDGCLNIVPLNEIRSIAYINYFYFIIYGTRLKITCNKKYVIWRYGPSEVEWINRGFMKSHGKKGKEVSFDIVNKI